ncbi:hypothetical protein VM98_33500, partial [Streptomyces rubellomurinus subsp. indigoferus]
PWTRHATGLLAAGAERPDWDLAAWPPAGAQPVGVEGLYSRLAEDGPGYGPAFQGLTAPWKRGEELFAEVRLPRELHEGAARFVLHPALLHAALHAAAAACRAASSSAGCRPNRAASSWSSRGSRTSANSSSPRFQSAVRPWNAGP